MAAKARTWSPSAAASSPARTRLALWGQARAMWMLSHLPAPLARAVTNLSCGGARLHDMFEVQDYARPRAGARTTSDSRPRSRPQDRHDGHRVAGKTDFLVRLLADAGLGGDQLRGVEAINRPPS